MDELLFKKLYLRFLKEEKVYNEKFLYFLNSFKNHSKGYKIFDASFSWNLSDEGKQYWYKKQLDLVSFILNNNGDTPTKEVINYYKSLIYGYSSSDSEDKEWYDNHVNNFKKFNGSSYSG